jgi:hypothetical protein
MSNGKLILALCLAAGGAFATAAQTAPATPAPATTTTTAAAAGTTPDGGTPVWIKPETAEQRKVRIGTEDPGPDPSPDKHFFRYGHSYHIEKTSRRWASFEGADEGWARPIGFVNVYHEIYQMNENYLWAWMPDPEPNSEVAAAAEEAPRYSQMQLDYWQKMRPEFAPLDVPAAGVTLRFEDSSQGLPAAGSWRNSLAVADMNGDGFVDIIAPSERGLANSVPAIFLGDGKGHWTFWKEVRWPHAVDYGSVVAADFDKDGNMDLAFGVHLTGVYAFLGDGKGNFRASDQGLPTDYPTRRIVVTDVDRDGYPDIVAISEGPTARSEVGPNPEYAKLRVYYNRAKATHWEGGNIAPPGAEFGGDWLAVGKFNGDNYPDFVGSSIYFNGPDILYSSTGAKTYEATGSGGNVVPYLSYHFANTTGKFTSKTLDDAVISFVRSWPEVDPKVIPTPPAKLVVGLDRITFTGKEPKRVPILRWGGSARGIWGMGSGDFDGDGNLDIIYTRADPRSIDILLGDGKGGFRHAKIEGMKVDQNTNYDVKVADVNGDGKPDVILAYESGATTAFAQRDGSIHVFLNRGSQADEAPKPAPAAK